MSRVLTNIYKIPIFTKKNITHYKKLVKRSFLFDDIIKLTNIGSLATTTLC